MEVVWQLRNGLRQIKGENNMSERGKSEKVKKKEIRRSAIAVTCQGKCERYAETMKVIKVKCQDLCIFSTSFLWCWSITPFRIQLLHFHANSTRFRRYEYKFFLLIVLFVKAFFFECAGGKFDILRNELPLSKHGMNHGLWCAPNSHRYSVFTLRLDCLTVDQSYADIEPAQTTNCEDQLGNEWIR